MRSCEYSKVPSGDKRKTKVLRIRDIRFFDKNTLIPHDSPNLSSADKVSITFRFQKNDSINETVTLPASGDIEMCPVKMWAKSIKRILAYEGTDENSTINTFFEKGKLTQITNKQIEKELKKAADKIGHLKLGFKSSEIGTHSIRSGAAMAMYLDDISPLTIKMIGRWKSDSFLNYIRKQVEQFSLNVTSRMLKNENFTHIPDPEWYN